ncbi:hypothetical protein CMK10_16590 [Candidatus Poribacteria bacterium]|nr:hypothetical protein [Candidatus Poribacteria bacterium]
MTTRANYKSILDLTEIYTGWALRSQVLEETDLDYGGFRCPEKLVCEPWAAANILSTLTQLYINLDSQYYCREDVLDRMELAIKFLLRSQDQDGTVRGFFCEPEISLPSTAVSMLSLLRSYKWLVRDLTVNGGVSDRVKDFLDKAVDGIQNEPVFVNYHQFIIAEALLEYDRLFDNPEINRKARSYIQDGIEISDDGLYPDRSPASNMIVNAAILSFAERLGQLDLLDFVRRNLNFLLYTFRSNGEVTTGLSEAGFENGLPSGYAVWKKMSIVDQNGLYATAGDLTLNTYLSRFDNGIIRPYLNHPNPNFQIGNDSRLFVTSNIGQFLETELELDNNWVNRLPMDSQYEKFYRKSNIAFIRSGKTSTTIMGNQSNFFSLHNDSIAIDSILISSIYQGFRHVLMTGLAIDRKTYLTESETVQCVFRPKSKKREIVALDFKIFMEIDRIKDGFELNFTTEGWDGIPLIIEFGLRKVGTLFVGDCNWDLSETDVVFLSEELAVIENNKDRIKIEGGKVEHKIFQAENNSNFARLFLAPITPYEGVIRITAQ